MSNEITYARMIGKVKTGAYLSEGAEEQFRLGKTGALIVDMAHGKYHEAVSRERVNAASVAVTGIAMGTALSTTPPLALHNPVNSGVNLSILKSTVAYLSGTLSYGIISYATVIQATVPTGGTEIVPKNALIGASRGKAHAYTGSTQTAATVLISPYSFGPQAATTALGITTAQDNIEGLFEIMPGYVFVMESTSAGAGTSPLCVMGLVWEEIPLY